MAHMLECDNRTCLGLMFGSCCLWDFNVAALTLDPKPHTQIQIVTGTV